ncbi:MAG TPA: ABC transporter substrate-binding protein [Roseomonas sp.]|jgi:NitT/TauT family transport system substrate-binding protein
MTKNSTARRGSPLSRRALGAGIAALGLARPALAQARPKIRIGVPTKAYWPTIITLAATQQGLFQKEGLEGEMTIYRGGAEAFEALAAGAADIILDPPSLVAAGLRRGVGSKLVAGASLGYFGWHLMVRADSPIREVAQIAGKNVGITSRGSGSDLLAQWTAQDRRLAFTRVPVGGGGLVPNLRSRNLDAAVIYSPLSFQLIRANQARSLIDFGAAVPPHCTAGWIATDRIIQDQPQAVQGAVNALFGGLAWLRGNRAPAIALIAENNEIPAEIAAMEYEETILKLSTDGALDRAQIALSLELAALGGMTDLAPVEEVFVTRFTPNPTR